MAKHCRWTEVYDRVHERNGMPRLDVFTLYVVTVAITFVTGLALLLVSTLNRTVRGIKRCAVAGFLLALAFTLYPLRVINSGKFIILLPNLFLFAGVFMHP